MYCKYCGKEIRDDFLYCKYCGKDIRSETAARVKPVDRTVFLILTLLLTAYFPFRLAGTRSMPAFLLTIPALVVCVGCWMAWAGLRRGRTSDTGLTLMGGGLRAQIWVFFAEGIAVAVGSVLSFGSVLNDSRVIIALSDTLVRVVLILLLLCAAIAACGVVLLICLRRIRRGIVSVKGTLSGRDAGRKGKPASGILGWTVAAAAVSAVKLYFASEISLLFRLLLYSRTAMTEGAVFDRLKDAFYASQSANVPQTVAVILFLGTLACVIVLSRENFKVKQNRK